MKTDIYTKIVLTIIAACLVIIVIKNIDFVPKTHAASTKTLTQFGDVIDVRIVGCSSYSGLPVELKGISTRDELNVKISGTEWGVVMPVKIESPSPLPVVMGR